MRKILKALSVIILLLGASGCTPDTADKTTFKIYYYNALLTIGEDFISMPSYIGQAPHSFEIYSVTHDGQVSYNPKLDGALTEKSHFYVNPETGEFFVNQTVDMKAGVYSVSMKCVSDGVEYTYPDMFVVKLNKAI